MKDFLMELFLENGERELPYRESPTGTLFAEARDRGFIEMIWLQKYDGLNLPYKLTAKALEYIKTND